MPDVMPCLWYAKGAEEAARLYVSLLPDSRIDSVTVMPGDTPSGPEGSVRIVEFTLRGRPHMAFEAGGPDAFNHAISLMIDCETQEEIDRLHAALSEGGAVEPCGWVRDRWGVSWQIAPRALGEMIKDPDRARARRVTEAMLGMMKLDLAGLQAAYRG